MRSLFRKSRRDVQTTVEHLARYGVPETIRDRLARYVREADDPELYRANPHRIADRLGVDTYTALGVMAYAVQEGLFDLNWEVHCPHCGQRARTFFTLQDGRGAEVCPNCQNGFDVHLDHEVRVTFTVNESVRRLSKTQTDPLPDDSFPPTYGLELLNVQPFRDLFAHQTLPPGESLQVTRVAILFTDLLGSTAMYARAGDPQAYRWVREHFEVLFRAAQRNHGVTVKTIGDAVMASFLTPADALQMAIDAHNDIAALNRHLALDGDRALSIRLGAHVGPCISVTLNERLDYFGATVNIASRVSHLSDGRDVVLTEEMLTDPETQEVAARYGKLESFEMPLRGYDRGFRLWRLLLRNT